MIKFALVVASLIVIASAQGTPDYTKFISHYCFGTATVNEIAEYQKCQAIWPQHEIDTMMSCVNSNFPNEQPMKLLGCYLVMPDFRIKINECIKTNSQIDPANINDAKIMETRANYRTCIFALPNAH